MLKSIPIHDRHAETRLFKSRIFCAVFFSVVLFFILVGRLVYLQIFYHEDFSLLSEKNRVRPISVAPTRGLIFDRYGRILAENLPSYQLEIVPKQLDDLDLTLTKIGEIIEIRESDLKRFKKVRRHRSSFEGIPLLFNLSDEEVAHFSVNKHRFPGVDIAARLSRHYPFGASGVHVIGYVGRIDEDDLQMLDEKNYKATSHIGKVGIEKFYENQLHGTVGAQQVEVNVEGRKLRELDKKPPLPGNNIYLSLDIELQKIAEQSLSGYTGAIVILEPDSGEILAFVSQPTYDPNPFVNGISVEEYEDLANAKDQPLFNRALQGQYPPGSTLKPFIGLYALENKMETYEHQIRCKGFYTLVNDDRKYRDWKKFGHGKMDLSNAIINSCDVFFYDLAFRMGIDRVSLAIKKFNFGKKTGVDLEGEKTGLVPNREWKKNVHGTFWYPGETLNSGIGQGYMLATPLQLAYATAIFANEGKLVQPKLVRAIQAPNGEMQAIQQSEIQQISIINQQHWDYIKKAMTQVVHGKQGTAKHIGFGLDFKIAGKTGTSQVISVKQDEDYDAEKLEKRFRDHALFVAFAPSENPKIALSVVVENGGSGGVVAAPIARKLIDFYMKNQNKTLN